MVKLTLVSALVVVLLFQLFSPGSFAPTKKAPKKLTQKDQQAIRAIYGNRGMLEGDILIRRKPGKKPKVSAVGGDKVFINKIKI